MLDGIWLGLAMGAVPAFLEPPPIDESRIWRDHAAAERYEPAYLALAWGGVRPAVAERSPWPVKVLSIGHTIASYQGYAGVEPYFHHGLDIRADAGGPVRAARGGKVVNIENYVPGNPAYWEVAILDGEGYVWQYHHLLRSSIPAAIERAFSTGVPIPDGEPLGTVYPWSVTTFGERYHHVHLNVVGAGKAYLNPFVFLDPLADRDDPFVESVGLLVGGKPQTSAVVPAGTPYSLYAVVGDRILHRLFTVPPHRIRWRVGGQMPVLVWEFESLPGGASISGHVHDFFVRGETCGDYACRRSVVDLGFRTGFAGAVFPTTAGTHSVSVHVEDFEGNVADRGFQWEVR